MSGSTTDTETSSLLALKLVALFVIPFCTIVGALPPLYYNKLRANAVALSYANIVSGSILLGFGFLHVLPDAVESWANYTDRVRNFPLPYALVLCAFFITLFIEKSVVKYIKATTGNVSTLLRKAEPNDQKDTQSVIFAENRSIDVLALDELTSRKPALDDHQVECCHAEFHTHDIGDPTGKFSPFVLTFALSVHAIFEGLAIGLTNSISSGVLICIGIAVHKWSEAFAMAVAFTRKGTTTSKIMKITCFFSLILPIGIAIGLAIDTSVSDESHDISSSILNSFAVGVFLYVSILGILVEEFSRDERLLSKVVVSLLACMIMGSLAFFET